MAIISNIAVYYPAGRSNSIYTIPDGITSVGDYSFSGNNNALIEITIPSTVKTIGSGAFYYRPSLKNVNIKID